MSSFLVNHHQSRLNFAEYIFFFHLEKNLFGKTPVSLNCLLIIIPWNISQIRSFIILFKAGI